MPNNLDMITSYFKQPTSGIKWWINENIHFLFQACGWWGGGAGGRFMLICKQKNILYKFYGWCYIQSGWGSSLTKDAEKTRILSHSKYDLYCNNWLWTAMKWAKTMTKWKHLFSVTVPQTKKQKQGETGPPLTPPPPYEHGVIGLGKIGNTKVLKGNYVPL